MWQRRSIVWILVSILVSLPIFYLGRSYRVSIGYNIYLIDLRHSRLCAISWDDYTRSCNGFLASRIGYFGTAHRLFDPFNAIYFSNVPTGLMTCHTSAVIHIGDFTTTVGTDSGHNYAFPEAYTSLDIRTARLWRALSVGSVIDVCRDQMSQVYIKLSGQDVRVHQLW